MRRFVQLVWDDIGLPPIEALRCIGVGIAAAIPIMGIVVIMAYILCWIIGNPFTDQAMSASIGILILIVGFVSLVSYMRRKWKESRISPHRLYH